MRTRIKRMMKQSRDRETKDMVHESKHRDSGRKYGTKKARLVCSPRGLFWICFKNKRHSKKRVRMCVSIQVWENVLSVQQIKTRLTDERDVFSSWLSLSNLVNKERRPASEAEAAEKFTTNSFHVFFPTPFEFFSLSAVIIDGLQMNMLSVVLSVGSVSVWFPDQDQHVDDAGDSLSFFSDEAKMVVTRISKKFERKESRRLQVSTGLSFFSWSCWSEFELVSFTAKNCLSFFAWTTGLG